MKNYSESQLHQMCIMLAQRDVEQSDDRTMFDVFMEGCQGWQNFDDDFVIEQFHEYFDDSDLFDE